MNTVVIIGKGKLADTLCKHLSEITVIRRTDISKNIPDAKLVLVLLEGDRPSLPSEAEEKLRIRGIPWFCAYVFKKEGVVGPLVRPEKPGCSQCAETRRALAGRNSSEVSEMLMKLTNPNYVPQTAKEVSPAGLSYMAHIISSETIKVLQDDKAMTEEHVYIINFSNLNSSVHYFLPDGACPVCDRLPDDSREAAEISLKKRLKINNSYRSRSMSDLREVLFKDY